MNLVQANYLAARSTRVRNVTLSVDGTDLVVAGDDIDIRVPFSRVKVDERLGRAARRMHLPDGAFCEVRDLQALDALLAQAGHRDSPVDRMQRQLRYVLAACLAFIMLVAAGYRWGLPLAARLGAQHLPPAVGRTITVQTLKVLDGNVLLPSKLSPQRRKAVREEFQALRLPGGGKPTSALLFRVSAQLKANAFTLPDGTIILLDDLVTAIGDDRQTMAVLAHELGHAYGHHGLRLLLQSSAVGAFMTLYIGDISTLLAAAPAAIVQAKYSQDLERQADDYGATLLQLNGMSPALMADALKTLAASHPEASKEGYLSSHPATDARIRHLRELGAAFDAK